MRKNVSGFALPSVLISSIIMLMVLVTAVSLTVAVRGSLDRARYDHLAGLAAEAGTAAALACLEANGDTVTWSSANPLEPQTDCNGVTVPGKDDFVLSGNGFKTRYVVSDPNLGSGNRPVSITARGYVELLRNGTATVWRSFENSNVVTLTEQTDSTIVGTSLDGYWTSEPDGYFFEDGSCKSRTDNANLFGVLGTRFGSCNYSGQGTDTGFNLPDSRGRIAVTKSSSETEFNTLGEVGGAKTVALSESNLPSHDHDFPGMTIFWGLGGGGNSFREHEGASDYIIAVGGTSPAGNTMYTNSSADGWADTYNAGSGTAHNNLQPYITVYRVIKY